MERLTLAQATERALVRLADARPAPRRRAGRRGGRARGARRSGCSRFRLQAAYARQSDVPEVVGRRPHASSRTSPTTSARASARRSRCTPAGGSSAQWKARSSSGRRAPTTSKRAVRDLVFEVAAAYWSLATAPDGGGAGRGARRLRRAPHGRAEPRAGRPGRAQRGAGRPGGARPRGAGPARGAPGRSQLAEANLRRLLDLPAGVARRDRGAARGAAPADATDADAPWQPRPSKRVPSARRAGARLAAAEARVRGEKGARRPQVDGGRRASTTRTRTAGSCRRPTGWKHSWDVDVSLTWTLFDGGRTGRRRSRARRRAPTAAREQLVGPRPPHPPGGHAARAGASHRRARASRWPSARSSPRARTAASPPTATARA